MAPQAAAPSCSQASGPLPFQVAQLTPPHVALPPPILQGRNPATEDTEASLGRCGRWVIWDKAGKRWVEKADAGAGCGCLGPGGGAGACQQPLGIHTYLQAGPRDNTDLGAHQGSCCGMRTSGNHCPNPDLVSTPAQPQFPPLTLRDQRVGVFPASTASPLRLSGYSGTSTAKDFSHPGRDILFTFHHPQ